MSPVPLHPLSLKDTKGLKLEGPTRRVYVRCGRYICCLVHPVYQTCTTLGGVPRRKFLHLFSYTVQQSSKAPYTFARFMTVEEDGTLDLKSRHHNVRPVHCNDSTKNYVVHVA